MIMKEILMSNIPAAVATIGLILYFFGMAIVRHGLRLPRTTTRLSADGNRCEPYLPAPVRRSVERGWPS